MIKLFAKIEDGVTTYVVTCPKLGVYKEFTNLDEAYEFYDTLEETVHAGGRA